MKERGESGQSRIQRNDNIYIHNISQYNNVVSLEREGGWERARGEEI